MIASPLSRQELQELARQVGGVAALVSRRSPQYRERAATLGDAATDDDWLAALAEEPRLVRRPIWRAAPGKPWRVGFDPAVWAADLGS